MTRLLSCVYRFVCCSCLLLGGLAGVQAAGPALPDYRAAVLNPDFLAGARSPRSGAFLAIGTDGSIWRSEAGAAAGEFADSDASATASLRRMAFSADGRVALVVGDAGVILRSLDDGLHWVRMALPPSVPQRDLRDVKALPRADGGTDWLVVGAGATVLRSLDDGLHWEQVALGAADVQDLDLNVLLPGPEGVVIAGGTEGSLWRSADGGRSWQPLQRQAEATPIVGLYRLGGWLWASSAEGRLWRCTPLGQPCSVVRTGAKGFILDMASDDAGMLLAVAHSGEVLRSTDGGQRWQMAPVGNGRSLNRVHYDALRKHWLMVGDGGFVLRSIDGARRWQRLALPHEPSLSGLSVQAGDDTVWAFGRGGALYRGNLATGSWEVIVVPQAEYLNALAVLPGRGAEADAVLAAGQAGWMTRSARAGLDWEPVPMRFVVEMYPTDFSAMLALPDGRSLVAAGPTGTIMRSDDAGHSWRTVMHSAFEKGEVLPALLMNPPASVLLAPEMNGAIYRSTDGGARWRRIPAPKGLPKGTLWRTGLVASQGCVALVVGIGSKLMRSADCGERWAVVDLGGQYNIFAAMEDARHGTLWLAGEGGVVLRSDDGGLRWRRLTVSPVRAEQPITQTMLHFLAPAPGTEGAWLLVGREGVVLRSTDGERWVQQPSGSDQDLRVALREPGSHAAVLVGRQGTVLRSHDDGRSWQALPSHTTTHFKAATFLPGGSLIAVGEKILRMAPRAAAR